MQNLTKIPAELELHYSVIKPEIGYNLKHTLSMNVMKFQLTFARSKKTRKNFTRI